MRIFPKILLIAVIALSSLNSLGGRTLVSAKLDSASMMMGSVTPLNIEVVQDNSVKGDFPLFKDLSQRGYATLLNDTIEISVANKPDTVKIGTDRIQINYHMLVQVFDSGMYVIPGLQYVAGNDTISSENMSLKVIPVNVTADDSISPMTGVQDPENPSIFDVLPDWIVYWWWIIPLAVILGLLIWWYVRRYKTTGTLLPPKPETPPHIVALNRLKRLKERKLCESGREKEYYTVLTDILRTYLEKRFGIKAMEMTSRQIMSTLADDESLRGSRAMMRQILDVADFVKFAKVRPLPDDNVRAYDNAFKFVEETKPREEITEKNGEGKSVDAAISYISKTKRGGEE